ncbi:hypothetical protein CALVIDRAFT_487233 [Calocera viscosa TUFC12733]|uniref:Major facilitator superfamily (MFS) profile domain-containing protein n=1 Tax=Calocera viscosa (strain TUFC12733) TaxID=1330018 RepID=A0A167IEJ2_CALVF|nr:hypothetical protein CALVIDRAFT_487233 [Calocera viscosa TUFC12733]
MRQGSGYDNETGEMRKISQKLENPLQGMSQAELIDAAEKYCTLHGMEEHLKMFKRGALLAAQPHNFDTVKDLTEDERVRLEEETTHKWRQPAMMYYVALISSLAAVVQGMDEAVVNGAQIFYYDILGISGKDTYHTTLQGLVNSAPYLCCFVLACWLTHPLNRFFGRRGTIWISCFIAGAASIWEAFTYSWPQLFAARLLLGIGIGPKSSTAPVYTAECAPAPIRGALVMQWQMWTAFGIALGDIVSVIFVNITPDVAWRLMLGSTVVAPIFVCSMIYFGPESPRWLVSKNRHEKAYEAMRRLRFTELQAARDLFYMNALLEAEAEMQRGHNLFAELFTIPRNRRATMASGLVMFMQQFCGVNVIAYYSSQVFVDAGRSRSQAILLTMGTGLVNWIFAIPGMLTIDTFGRRNLLLVTFPIMGLCLLITGFAFWIPNVNAQTGVVAMGIYLFEVAYSPGEGPVPFTYSAEAFPLYIRDIGMSWATAVTWCFNFVLSISFPTLLTAFKPQGAFGWYAAWCFIGWIVILLVLPETKGLTLEELDVVFSVPTDKHAAYQLRKTKWWIRKYLLFQHVKEIPPLYEHEALSSL